MTNLHLGNIMIPPHILTLKLWDKDITREDFAQLSIKYATLLNLPVRKGMFIPCNDKDEVLDKPFNYDIWKEMHLTEGSTIGFYEHEKYLEAENKCYFKDFRVDHISPYRLVVMNTSETTVVKMPMFGNFEFLYDLINKNLEFNDFILKDLGWVD